MIKSKKISKLFIILMLYAGLTSKIYAACEHGYFLAGGDGSASNPYLVSTESDFRHAMQETRVYHYKQLNNISITKSDSRLVFYGIYDGNNKELIVSSSYAEGRIIDSMETGSVLQNVTFSGQTTGFINLYTNIYSSSGTIENVINKINMSGGEDNCMAGIVRTNYGGKVINCKNYGNFMLNTNSVSKFVGGVVGNNLGMVEGCYSKSTITVNQNTMTTSRYMYIGGISYYNGQGGTINNSYTDMITVTNNRNLDILFFGGIAANNFSMISNCYNLGTKLNNNATISTGLAAAGAAITNNVDLYLRGTLSNKAGSVKNCYFLDKSNIGYTEGTCNRESSTNVVNLTATNTNGKRTDAQMKLAEQVVLLNQGQSMPGWKAGTNGWLYPEPLGFVEMKMDTSITVIGDNTKVPLSLKWSSNISTVEILDKTNNISLYKGVPQSNIAVELSKDGDISLVCRGYATSGELLAESPAKIINKRSVLNEILKEVVSSVNPLRVMAVMDGYRYYDINTSNQQSINKILEYNPPLYFISDSLHPIFNVFLKTS